MTTKLDEDVLALTRIADAVWAGVGSSTGVPLEAAPQIAAAMVSVLGQEYLKNRVGYLKEPKAAQATPDNQGL